MKAIDKIKELLKVTDFKDEIIDEIFDLSTLNKDLKKDKDYKLLRFVNHSKMNDWNVSKYFNLKSQLKDIVEDCWDVANYDVLDKDGNIKSYLLDKLKNDEIVRVGEMPNVDGFTQLSNFVKLLEISIRGYYLRHAMGYLDLEDVPPHILHLMQTYLK